MNTEEQIQSFRDLYGAMRAEINKVIVGHEAIVDGTLIALLAGGHVLLEGVPGLGKTLLVRTLSQVLQLSFNRVQFTPDLMPADILGTNIVMEVPGGGREFRFQKGPIFAHLVLADEINRATPKTQSALLEAMQEHSVTAGGEIRRLDEPFFVLATQNPIDQEGTYPLPEAQLDRFFFKLLVGYPTALDLSEILSRTTENRKIEVNAVVSHAQMIELQRLVREVPAASHVKDYAVRLIMATHPKTETAVPITNQFLRFGSSPRGAQSLLLGAKVRALTHGRFNVSFEDIQAVVFPTLRHRCILNFEAEAEGITTDDVIQQILKDVPADASLAAALAKAKGMATSLITPELLRRLEQFQLLARRRAKSSARGERRSRARGQSVEFADHRNYVPGDDFRYLDWNLFGRLDRLFLKLYEEERELPVTIFLDASESMTFGKPRKFDFARQIAAAVGYVALCGFDRVSVVPFPDAADEVAIRGALRSVRGRKSSMQFFQNLNRVNARGSAALNDALRRGALAARATGLAIVLSDFLDPAGYEPGLTALIGRGFQVSAVQILAPEELNPDTYGDLRLVDSETGAVQEVTFAKFRLNAYRQTVMNYIQRLREFCQKRGINFFTSTSDASLDKLLLKQLREAEVWG